MTIELIVGLGNPGPEYALTRHNAGAWFAESIAQYHQTEFKLEKKFHAHLAQIKFQQHSCLLALPTTFMNRSGQCIQALMQFYKWQPSQVLVAHDDLDLPSGTARLKFDGGHGGHNGLRDIISHIGKAFYRLRIGIGHPGHRDLVHDYVLHRPSQHDKMRIHSAIEEAMQSLPLVLSGDINGAMKQLHTQNIVFPLGKGRV
ncbi:MAG: aminoacyl-tRNA hydrolase [Gammaproteobacteria bacterium]